MTVISWERPDWLRASVLGANDGIVSTSSLLLGLAAAHASHATLLLSGTAALVAGAMSMAAGEYVSVHSQADTEAAALAQERAELREDYRRRAARIDRHLHTPRHRCRPGAPGGGSAHGARCIGLACPRRIGNLAAIESTALAGRHGLRGQLFGRCRPAADRRCYRARAIT